MRTVFICAVGATFCYRAGVPWFVTAAWVLGGVALGAQSLYYYLRARREGLCP